eukprot:scaffold1112_cov116-Isochrysis_galbana.AAC.35
MPARTTLTFEASDSDDASTGSTAAQAALSARPMVTWMSGATVSQFHLLSVAEQQRRARGP